MVKFDHEKIADIAHRFGVRDVYRYGSQITGRIHAKSDIDVGVVFERGIPNNYIEIYGGLASELAVIFGAREEGPRLDLAFLEEAPVNMLFKMVSEGELVYTSDQKSADDFLESVIARYHDQKYFIDEFYRTKMYETV